MDNKIIFDDKILEKILDIASQMLMVGSEIRRTEDTVKFLCSAYGADYVDVFCITSSLNVTVRFKDKPPLTQTRRIASKSFDMVYLAKLNSLSREICEKPKTAQEIDCKLKAFKIKHPPTFLTALSWAVVSGSFAAFFGGNLIESVFSFFFGIVLFLLKNLFSKFLPNNYFVIILCGICGGILSSAPPLFIEECSSFYISIGNIMLLIPGIALTTSIRDIFSGDPISGLLRFFEAIIVSLVLAWSFAISTFTKQYEIHEAVWFVQCATAFSGSLGFACIFNSSVKTGILSAFNGLLSWSIVLILQFVGVSEHIAFLLAAICATLYCETFARIIKLPATAMLVVSLIPLVPGKALYLTMWYFVEKNYSALIASGLNTIVYAISISAGIIIVTEFFNSISAKRKTINGI